jgi:hypothetical protein
VIGRRNLLKLLGLAPMGGVVLAGEAQAALKDTIPARLSEPQVHDYPFTVADGRGHDYWSFCMPATGTVIIQTFKDGRLLFKEKVQVVMGSQINLTKAKGIEYRWHFAGMNIRGGTA